ncbi:MAG: tryptophan 2,3-dioxygenase family protein [Pseudomonadota bacterium]
MPEMDYGDYLRLDRVLDAQAPLSDAPDEMLFIIQHQTSELWMKLILHELGAARAAIGDDRLTEAFKGITRCARIFEQLNSAWDVLRTMTPSDYTTFREALGQSSGFQSVQYRLIVFLLGNRDIAKVRLHRDRAKDHAQLSAELTAPSLYDAVLDCAARRGHKLPAAHVERDRARPHQPDPDLIALWATVYQDPTAHWTLYDLGEKLVDLEDYFRRWRFNHVTTVERVIGLKRGTGGSSGVGYLKKMLEVELFPDLWRVRTEL